MATFDGAELYPTFDEKAAVLGFSLIQGHPFIDGNKRVGHAAMEVFLVLNGFELRASVDEQEAIVLALGCWKHDPQGLCRLDSTARRAIEPACLTPYLNMQASPPWEPQVGSRRPPNRRMQDLDVLLSKERMHGY